nr:MAG TPA: hypothetical protein [Caudoviricetes sp.]
MLTIFYLSCYGFLIVQALNQTICSFRGIYVVDEICSLMN